MPDPTPHPGITSLNGRRRWFFRLVFLLAVTACGGILIVMQHRLANPGRYETRETQRDAISGEEHFYLPTSAYLELVTLGHKNLAGDLLMAKAMVYYGSHYRERGRISFGHLERLFTAALTLDPENRDGFLFAANILASSDPHASLRILDLASRYHPDYWKLPEMAGFIHYYHLHDLRRAARYYELASALPGHPPYTPSLAGKLYRESGLEENALRVLHNFWSTTRDPRLKESFKSSINTILERVKRGEFQLAASITGLLDPVSPIIRKDPGNPHFRELAETETLHVAGVRARAPGKQDRLFAFFQKDYSEWMLNGAHASVEFIRRRDGSLKRDPNNRLHAIIHLAGGRLFQEIAVQSGMLEADTALLPPGPLREKLDTASQYARQRGAGIFGYPPRPAPTRDILKNIGQIVVTDFRVSHIERTENHILLYSGGAQRNRLAVAIPLLTDPSASSWTAIKEFRIGQHLRISGFVAVSGNSPRVTIHCHEQLTLLSH